MTTIESDPLTLFDVPPARPVIDTRPLGHYRRGEQAPDVDTLNKGCRDVLFAIRLIATGTVRQIQALMDGYERNVIARRLDDLEGFGFVRADRTTRPITWSVR